MMSPLDNINSWYALRISQILLIFTLCLTVSGCDQPPPLQEDMVLTEVGDITTKRLLDINAEPGSWVTGGRDYQQSYYSPLDQINKTNVQTLGFAWQYDIDTTHGFEATPLVVDGVMFSSGPKGAVYALDAKTGEQRWIFEPIIDKDIFRKVCCGVVNRGIAVWQGLVYVASLDGYLYALDADTGKIRWKVDTITERERGYTVTGAPYIAKDVVVIGNSGADLDARGYVTAYDVTTGEYRWRFFTVPGNPDQGFEHPELKMASKTWDANSLWQVGLGGTVWDGMAYDPDLNLLYIGTGNAAPYARKLRSPAGGDNLFLSSILAINPDTGRLIWHYQTTPADNWDYTSVQKMILASLNVEGAVRKVIMQAPKNGFFYVLDRTTGELLSAEPYVEVNWASHVDKQTGRPVETGQGEYFEEPKLIFPGPAGGHNWQPMAYSPSTGLVYIPTLEAPAIYFMPKEPFEYQQGSSNAAARFLLPMRGPLGFYGEVAKRELPPIETLTKGQPDDTARGFLKAWNPVTNTVEWEVETSDRWAGDLFSTWNGGGVMTSEGGLVFQGRGTGAFIAIDADTGEQLHSIDVGTSMMAAPMTYSIGGEQYIAIMAGIGGAFGQSHPPGTAAHRYGNAGRIIAFKLGGGAVPHPPEIDRSNDEVFTPEINRRGTSEQIHQGNILYARNCAKCHVQGGDSGMPDLTKMIRKTHEDFLDIVLHGVRADRGMGGFEGILSEVEAEAIQVYLIEMAWQNFEQFRKLPVPHSLVEPESE